MKNIINGLNYYNVKYNVCVRKFVKSPIISIFLKISNLHVHEFPCLMDIYTEYLSIFNFSPISIINIYTEGNNSNIECKISGYISSQIYNSKNVQKFHRQ